MKSPRLTKMIVATGASVLVMVSHAEPLSPPLSGVGAEVMKANPFLSNGVGPLPPVRENAGAESQSARRPGGGWGDPIASVNLDPCPNGVRVHLGAAPDHRPTCLRIEVRGASNIVDPNHAKRRTFEAALYPDSHKIQRIYETGIDPKLVRKSDADSRVSAMRLIASISVFGEVTESSVLLKVSNDGNKVEDASASAAPPAKPADAAAQTQGAAECNNILNMTERVKCLAKGAVKK